MITWNSNLGATPGDPRHAFEVACRGLHFEPARVPLHSVPTIALFKRASRRCFHDHPYRGNLRYRTQYFCFSCAAYRYTSLLLFLFLVSPIHHRPYVLSPIGPCQLPVHLPLPLDLLHLSFVLQNTRSVGGSAVAASGSSSPRALILAAIFHFRFRAVRTARYYTLFCFYPPTDA